MRLVALFTRWAAFTYPAVSTDIQISFQIYALRPPYLPSAAARGFVEVTVLGHRKAFEGSQPAGASAVLWNMIQQCWNFSRKERPTMSAIHSLLLNLKSS